MSVVSALVLVILGSFIHCACALTCYECASPYGGWCDDPLDTANSQVQQTTCSATYDACVKGEGSAKCKNTEIVLLADQTFAIRAR